MLHLKIKNQHFRIIDIYHINIIGFKLIADFNPYPFNGIYLGWRGLFHRRVHLRSTCNRT